jgi:integrase
MQTEPFDEDDGYRVWLSERETHQLMKAEEERPKRQLAMQLMLCGLRSDELEHAKTENIRTLETDEEAYKLRVRDGKTGYRETPVPVSVAKEMRMLKNATQTRKDQPLIDVTERTIQRWVKEAAESIDSDKEGWTHLTPHDLRRTWATRTYYSLSGSRAKEVVMTWGGWRDEQTFSRNYLGKEPDVLALELMEEANLR